MATYAGLRLRREGSAARHERAWLLLLLVSWFALAYFGSARLADPGAARTLRTALDDAIPFVPASLYVYVEVYVAMLLPLFVVRSPVLLRRTALAYALAIALACACFVLFPVSSAGLRPELAVPERPDLTTWGLLTLYALDTPLNLFPSLHVAIMALATYAAWRARRAYGLLSLAPLAAVAASTCTVKQHYLADVAGGLALAALLGALVIRDAGRAGAFEASRAHGWSGLAGYAAFHLIVYGVAVLGYRLGLRPWEWV